MLCIPVPLASPNVTGLPPPSLSHVPPIWYIGACDSEGGVSIQPLKLEPENDTGAWGKLGYHEDDCISPLKSGCSMTCTRT